MKQKKKIKIINRAGVWLLVCAVVLVLLWLRLSTLQEEVENPSVDSAIAKGLIHTEDEDVFLRAVSQSLITTVQDEQNPQWHSQLLQVMPQDKKYVLKERGEDERRETLEDLYSITAGLAVRSAVQQWNEAHLFSAIRDDLSEKVESDAGITSSRWEIFDAEVAASPVKTYRGVPEFCVFVTGGVLRDGFNSWLQSVHPRTTEYRRHLHLKKSTRFQVQVVGKVVSVEPKGKRTARVLPKKGSLRLIQASLASPGSTVDFSLPAGEYDLRLVVEPVEFSCDSIPGLNISLKEGKPVWHNVTARRTVRPSPVEIVTADEVPLFQEGKVTAEGEKMQLATLVGMNTADRGSLGRIFSASGKKKVELTIDGDLQRMVQEKLEHHLTTYFTRREHFFHERKGALVMMDADSGEILAAASYPPFSGGASDWDYSAFSTFYPNKTTKIFRPWQGLNKDNAPGSTFKPVIALAAMAGMETSENARAIAKLMKGYGVSKKTFARSGLTLNCQSYDVRANKGRGQCYAGHPEGSVSNYSSETIGGEVTKDGKKEDKTYGLPQAVRDSMNVWFIRLAWLLDGKAAYQYDSEWRRLQAGEPEPQRPWFHISAMAEKLGFAEPLNLLANVDDASLSRYRNHAGGSKEGDVSYGGTGRLGIFFQNGLSGVLAQTAIGQSMSTSTLQMAKVAATISGGEIVQPVLIHAIDDREYPTLAQEALDIDSNWLELLRDGMKKVPESGSGKKAFKNNPQKKFIYAKTGTASVKAKKGEARHWSAWFMGWKEPQVKGERRIAFAGWVSHSLPGKDSGGKVVAPLISDIFMELEKVRVNQENEKQQGGNNG